MTFDDLVGRAASALHARTGEPAEVFLDGFTEGTRTGATPVAKSVALPHMRLEGLGTACMVLVRCGVEVEVPLTGIAGAEQASERVHSVFFLVSPAEDPSQHLRMLAQLASRIDEDDFLDEWLAARNEVQLREVFLRNERYLSIRVTPGSPGADLGGRKIRELDLPAGCLVAAVRREDARSSRAARPRSASGIGCSSSASPARSRSSSSATAAVRRPDAAACMGGWRGFPGRRRARSSPEPSRSLGSIRSTRLTESLLSPAPPRGPVVAPAGPRLPRDGPFPTRTPCSFPSSSAFPPSPRRLPSRR